MSNNSFFCKNNTLNLNGKIFDLKSPIVMGILNLTPDSFYDGGKYKNESDILHQTSKMLEDGATIIDIGAVSSKPNADEVSIEIELKRLIPVINLLKSKFNDIILSVDTYRSEIAKIAVSEGADMINDISGGTIDENMFPTVSELKVPYILMHIQGNPQNMQQSPVYKDVTKEIILYLSKKINKLKLLGLNDIIIDPGFGFGKTLEHNYEVLNNLELFKFFELPVLVGISRKSMIYKLLGNSPEEALNGTIALNTIALLKGADILRVHDVKEAIETIKIVQMLSK